MSKKDIRKCIVCGSEYEYCPSCNKYSNMPRWKFNFDVENCKDIFMIASAYNSKTITAEDARLKFEKCDLSKKESFSESIVRVMEEVFSNKEENKNVDSKREVSTDTVIEQEKKDAQPKKEYNKHFQNRHDHFRKQ